MAFREPKNRFQTYPVTAVMIVLLALLNDRIKLLAYRIIEPTETILSGPYHP
jgi:hypothetical protein